jgi:hypothetical protein
VVGGKGIVENEEADRVCLGSAEMIPKRQRRKKIKKTFHFFGGGDFLMMFLIMTCA